MRKMFFAVALLSLLSCQRDVVDTLDKGVQTVDLNKASLYKQDLFSALSRIRIGADAIFKNEARGFSPSAVEADALSLLGKENVHFRKFLLSVGVLESECDELESYPGGLPVLAMAIYELQMRQHSSHQGLRTITFNEALSCVGSTITGLEIGSILSNGLVGRAVIRALVSLVGKSMARVALGPVGVVATVALMSYCLYEADQSYTAVCSFPVAADTLVAIPGVIPDWASPRPDSVKPEWVAIPNGRTSSSL